MTRSELEIRLIGTSQRQFSGGVSSEEVVDAELEFIGHFPEDFRDFLFVYGSGYVESEEFIGLGGPDHLNIVKIAKLLRSPSSHSSFPARYVPLREDGFGNFDCLELRSSSEKQSTVVEWIHDAGDDQEAELICKGYWEWFSRALDLL